MARRAVFFLGLLAVIAGLIWAAQGSGYFPYPASSFMIDQRPWIFRGVMTAACGALAMLLSRKL